MAWRRIPLTWVCWCVSSCSSCPWDADEASVLLSPWIWKWILLLVSHRSFTEVNHAHFWDHELPGYSVNAQLTNLRPEPGVTVRAMRGNGKAAVIIKEAEWSKARVGFAAQLLGQVQVNFNLCRRTLWLQKRNMHVSVSLSCSVFASNNKEIECQAIQILTSWWFSSKKSYWSTLPVSSDHTEGLCWQRQHSAIIWITQRCQGVLLTFLWKHFVQVNV